MRHRCVPCAEDPFPPPPRKESASYHLSRSPHGSWAPRTPQSESQCGRARSRGPSQVWGAVFWPKGLAQEGALEPITGSE